VLTIVHTVKIFHEMRLFVPQVSGAIEELEPI